MKSNVVKLRRNEARPAADTAVLAGLAVGRIEGRAVGPGGPVSGPKPGRASPGRLAFTVRLLAGETIVAQAADGVDPAFLDECHRERRTVLVSPGPTGAVVLGALQTASATAAGKKALRLSGETIELDASQGIALAAGKSKLRLSADGAIHLSGQRATISVARLVKILSALVELP